VEGPVGLGHFSDDTELSSFMAGICHILSLSGLVSSNFTNNLLYLCCFIGFSILYITSKIML
jgi:hypothetical protein